MEVQLTNEQLRTVKQMMEYAQAFCNQIYHIMENHGLDKIDGCSLIMTVDPKMDMVTRNIQMGTGKEFGLVRMARGKIDKKYMVYGNNSVEYELLFADDAIKQKMFEILDRNKKPNPPDGLWVGDDYKGEW